MKSHIITIVNNASFENPEHVVKASVREPRAIKKARRLSMGNPHVMLFKVVNGQKFPISLKRRHVELSKRSEGHNSWPILMGVLD